MIQLENQLEQLTELAEKYFDMELESIPLYFHDLIPEDMPIEEKLWWIVRGKKVGLFGSDYTQAYKFEDADEDAEQLMDNNLSEKDSEMEKFMNSDDVSRAEKLEKLIHYLMNNEMEQIPEKLKEFIPSKLTLEEKLKWIRKAKKKGLFQSNMNMGGHWRGSKPLGSGAFTGPGTAPGTGPGTAPWLEEKNMSIPAMKYEGFPAIKEDPDPEDMLEDNIIEDDFKKIDTRDENDEKSMEGLSKADAKAVKEPKYQSPDDV